MKIPPELGHVRIVAIKKGNPGGREALHQLILGAGNARHPIGKILRVGAADVGDDPPVRVSDARQGRDFAGVRHAHFDHRDFVLRLQFEQLQGHAKFVVEVSLGAEHMEPRAQNLSDRFLGGGFAGAAGDPDDALIPVPAHRGGQGLQRHQRIVHNQQGVGTRQLEKIRYLAARDNRGARASLKRSRDKGVRIIALPADGEEEIPRRKRAGVDGISCRRVLGPIAFP